MGSVEFVIGEVLKSKRFATYIKIIDIDKGYRNNYKVAILYQDVGDLWVSHDLLEEFYARLSLLEKELI